ncbi:MAG: putative HhH-GPD family protein [Glaciecola sp.]|jgi:uncharacterized HhH-GPD family protein
MATNHDLHLTGEEKADRLLSTNPLALVIGMLLDQQVPMEWAFASPATLEDRLGEPLTASTIAGMSPEALEELFGEKPALHRYPSSMAKRVHELCMHLLQEHDGLAENIWNDAADGKELFSRVAALPGYGKQKAQIFVSLLAKQLGVNPEGWQKVTGDYGLAGFRSIADVTSPETLRKVRETKQAAKAAAKQAKAKATAAS